MEFKTFIEGISKNVEEYKDFKVYINGESIYAYDICYPGDLAIQRGDPKNIYITLFTEKGDTVKGYYTFVEKKGD